MFANFEGANLSGAKFKNAFLSGADFTGASVDLITGIFSLELRKIQTFNQELRYRKRSINVFRAFFCILCEQFIV